MRGLLDGAGAATGIDFRDCEYFVGTSAGSIVAAAAGRRPRARLGRGGARRAGLGAGARIDARWTTRREGGAFAALGRLGPDRGRPVRRRSRLTATAARRRRRPRRRPGRRAEADALDARARQARGRVRRRVRRAAADRRGRPPQRQARDVRRARRAGRDRRAGGARVVLDPVGVRAGGDRRARVRRRRRLEPDEPRRRRRRGAAPRSCASTRRPRLRPLSSVSNAAALAESLALKARGARVRTLRPDADAAEAMGSNYMDRGRGRRSRLRPATRRGGRWRDEPPGRQPPLLGRPGAVATPSPPAATGPTTEPSWGIWKIPEADVGALPDVDGLDVIELGCGTAYFSAWLARRGARPVGIDQSPEQLATARAMQAEHGLEFPLIEGDAEAVPLPDASFDFALSEYGASLWCEPDALDRRGRAAAAPRRPARVPHQLAAAAPLHRARRARRRASASQRPQFGLHRVEWDDEEGHSIEFHLPHGEMLRVLRDARLRGRGAARAAPAGGREHALRVRHASSGRGSWPCEEIWVARKRLE